MLSGTDEKQKIKSWYFLAKFWTQIIPEKLQERDVQCCCWQLCVTEILHSGKERRLKSTFWCSVTNLRSAYFYTSSSTDTHRTKKFWRDFYGI